MNNNEHHCGNCEHVIRERLLIRGQKSIAYECRHPKVAGLMGCNNCRNFNAIDLFQLVTKKGQPAQLRCPEVGCQHVQPMPRDDDARIGFIGRKRVTDYDNEGVIPPATFCGGWSPDTKTTTATATRKPLTKKQRRAAAPTLFD